MLTANELFDEAYYLNSNSDVAVAVSKGEFSTGFAHYNQFGQFEQRNPSAYFDTSYYLQKYQDVASEVNARKTTAFTHFINFGQSEERNPNQLFDTKYYLQQYQDVAAAVNTDILTGIQHFIEFGDREGRAPSSFVDTNFYLGRNTDVANAVKQGTIGATEHFIAFGSKEGRIPRQMFDKIYVFGDSQSDDGNLYAILGGFLPPSPPYFGGRFSNGPVWTEYLAPELGLPVDPANNFAIGGAQTGNEDVISFEGAPPAPPLQKQVDNFVATHPVADPKALYVVYAGGNDYLVGGATEAGPTINNLATAVTKLAAIGGKNFMMPNLPNPSGSPFSVSQSPEFQQSYTQLVDQHASILAATIPNLEKNLNINIIPVDFTGFLRQVRANPQNYGITNLGNVVPGAGGSPEVANFTLPPGVNPDQYLYWDLAHLSTHSHQLISTAALRATTAIGEVVQIL
ncbi:MULTISPECIES: SGNH/GDSL hydrolase family protein [Aerosakkonema]|uniref:SGNH/GDSL hydrolase family protein n=1 Tax=Aerosakkonema TaxID=1246629 RepID=UPI0035BA453F